MSVSPHRSLAGLWSNSPAAFRSRLYHPDRPAEPHLSLDLAFEALARAAQPAPPGLIPVTYVDDRSLACVVCQPEPGKPAGFEGSVIRWHLDPIPPEHQGALLDLDAWDYAQSLVAEAKHFDRGYKGMQQAAERYDQEYTKKQRLPKPETLRPFQLACQNVIVGLAAMRHDDITNAHLIEYWQFCDVPHVATSEGCRALCVLMLCDAFQAGGAMELNFERHPERRVPAALSRYGRTQGIRLGADMGGTSISPGEARELFVAVTPMAAELRQRVNALAAKAT